MEIAFEQKNLRDQCENKAIADSLYGVEVANKLRNRLTDLRAFRNVAEIMIGNPEEVHGHPFPVFKINFGEKLIIVFTPNHLKIPRLEDGNVEWNKVTRIKIVSIGK